MSNRMPLFLINPSGELVPMRPSAPATEDELQTLIAEHPTLIAGSEEPLLLIQREQGIADEMDGSPRWSVDHLFVTPTAIPVLVEVKRAVDTRLRREVVGQMLDYAANAVAHWPKGTVEAHFRANTKLSQKDPDELLSDFLTGGMDADRFWEEVDKNFRAGQIKLVFVADAIPDELARIVEFLNGQMTADVRAVELRYFEGDNGVRTLSPRVIGETEQSRSQKIGGRPKLDPITIDDWLNKHIAPRGETVMQGAAALLQQFKDLDLEVSVASTQGSIFSRVKTTDGKNTYPLFLTKAGKCQIGFGWVTASSELASEEKRQEYYNAFSDAVGGLSGENFMTGFPSFPLERLASPEVTQRFRRVASEFVAACRIGYPVV
jgi:hypothetical protein